MSSRRERKKIKLLLIFISCIVFGIGYIFLNVVSRIFEVPLGITFHVILGCTLMAVSGIYIVYTIKQLYFTKRRKRTKRIYLDDNSNEKSE
jgi:predicted membrane protein